MLHMKSILVGGLALGLGACSTMSQAPATSNLSVQDLNAITTGYQLVRFDLAECADLQAGGANAQTLHVAQAICADATNYQAQLKQLALARNITLPNDLRYDLGAKDVELHYHADPDVNTQYLRDQIDSHQDALAVFRDEALNGNDPQIKAFSAGAIPVVQGNLLALRAAS